MSVDDAANAEKVDDEGYLKPYPSVPGISKMEDATENSSSYYEPVAVLQETP